MFTDLELAQSRAQAALTAVDNNSPDGPEPVSLATAKAGDTRRLVSGEMVQRHAGMTDAHDAGRPYRDNSLLPAIRSPRRPGRARVRACRELGRPC